MNQSQQATSRSKTPPSLHQTRRELRATEHNMAHQHAHAHLVRRQRDRDDEDDEGVAVVTRYVTAKNTYTVPVRFITAEPPEPSVGVMLPPPAVISRPPQSLNGDGVRQSSTRAANQASATSSKKANDDVIKPPASSVQVQSTLMISTKTPTPNAGSLGAALASATATAGAIASGAPAEGGMSTGAKAGLALGLLILVGALLTGVLLLYRRKKKQEMAASKDNEKIDLNDAPRPLPPQMHSGATPVIALAAAPSIRTNRTTSTAPRLSLRPVTEFDPAFIEQRKSAGNLLNVTAAAGPAPPSKDRDLPDRPRSAWERPGAASAAPAENPFNDPHSPAVNPFGNDAALDPNQAQIPNSPPNASPLHSTQPSADFANPAVAIAAADTANALAPPSRDFPAPPSIHGASDGVPASPAWTEDFPASPGPAPAGPLPVAGAIVGGRPTSPSSPVDNVHRVQLDFKPSMQDELGLHAGQLVRMLHEYDDGWVSIVPELLHCRILTASRLFAFAWTVLNKVSSPVRAFPSTLSSHVLVLPGKARHHQACVAHLSAHQMATAASLNLVLSRLLAVATLPARAR